MISESVHPLGFSFSDSLTPSDRTQIIIKFSFSSVFFFLRDSSPRSKPASFLFARPVSKLTGYQYLISIYLITNLDSPQSKIETYDFKFDWGPSNISNRFQTPINCGSSVI